MKMTNSRSVEIATIKVEDGGVTITTANGESYRGNPGDTIRLNYQFEDEFIAVLEELAQRNS